jgi:deazaflavin-dependent oxidoreductase (nitroreductase family)
LEGKLEAEDSIPRPGSVIYNIIVDDQTKQKKAINRFKRINKYLVVPLYRMRLLPLIGFGRIFVLLSTRGRKTGKKRFTPLEYHRIDGVIHVFSSRGEKADWYRNMLARPDDVEVLVGFRRRQAKVEIINNFAQFKDLMRWYVTKHPRLAKSFLGWDVKKDDPEKADFSKIAKLLRIVRVHETPKES